MALELKYERFDERFLEASATWQQDPEIRELINAAPFSRQTQIAWYASLPTRNDYRIWGVSLKGVPVGVVGLKGIGQGAAEFFGYLGDKTCWGKGLGRQLLDHAEGQARSMGVEVVRLRVLDHNTRAIRLYQGAGYYFCMKPDSHSAIMVKILPSNPPAIT